MKIDKTYYITPDEKLRWKLMSSESQAFVNGYGSLLDLSSSWVDFDNSTVTQAWERVGGYIRKGTQDYVSGSNIRKS